MGGEKGASRREARDDENGKVTVRRSRRGEWVGGTGGRIRGTGRIRDFKTNISRVNPAWMYPQVRRGMYPSLGDTRERSRERFPRRKESGANRRRFALHISRGIVSVAGAPSDRGKRYDAASDGGIYTRK